MLMNYILKQVDEDMAYVQINNGLMYVFDCNLNLVLVMQWVHI